MQGNVINGLAMAERFRDEQAFVFGPTKSCSGLRGSFFGPGARLFAKKPLNMLAERTTRRRLKAVAIGGQHFVKRVSCSENHFRDQPRVLFGEVRGQNIFQLMSQFTEFAIATGG